MTTRTDIRALHESFRRILAAGHTDYSIKFALYCAELAVKETP